MRDWFHDRASSLTLRVALRPENLARSRRAAPILHGSTREGSSSSLAPSRPSRPRSRSSTAGIFVRGSHPAPLRVPSWESSSRPARFGSTAPHLADAHRLGQEAISADRTQSVAPGEMGANLQQRAPEAALEPGESGHAIYWLNRPFLPCFPHSSAIP